MVQNPWLVYPQFCAFLANCFAQSTHNFKVIFLIDRTTLWQEFMMHYAIAIEENSEQNLHIWPKLTSYFRSWLSLGWLGFGFNVIGIHSQIVTFFSKSESTLNIVNISWAMSLCLVARIHDAPRYCNRRKQWAKIHIWPNLTCYCLGFYWIYWALVSMSYAIYS